MNAHTQRQTVAGPSGAIECAVDAPAGTPRGVAVVCHPHPQHGGTMDNKVVQTLARACVQLHLQVQPIGEHSDDNRLLLLLFYLLVKVSDIKGQAIKTQNRMPCEH
jgi:hypothetical protein